MTVQAIDPKGRWSFGKLSVQIAVWIFVLTWVMFIAVTIFLHNLPKKSFLGTPYRASLSPSSLPRLSCTSSASCSA